MYIRKIINFLEPINVASGFWHDLDATAAPCSPARASGLLVNRAEMRRIYAHSSLVGAMFTAMLTLTNAAPQSPNVVWTTRTHEPGLTQGAVKTYQV